MINHKQPTHISVVSPVYASELCLEELCERLVKTLETITLNFEIILVNDASPQNDWNIIKTLAQKEPRIKGINFSRNFGQHKAISAGVNHVKSDWLVVMDCDLQDQPEEIINLYKKASEGFDVVFARRNDRQDVSLKIQASFLFSKVFNYLAETKTDHTVANFSIVNTKVINAFNKFQEQTRAYPLIIRWLGFNTTYIDVEHLERKTGKSSYTWEKLFVLAFDLIIASSNKPLKLSIKFGLLMSFSSFLIGLYFFIRKIFFATPLVGWTSIIVSMFFLFGLLFANLGIVGIYLGKVFEEVKNRPLYVVKESIGLDS